MQLQRVPPPGKVGLAPGQREVQEAAAVGLVAGARSNTAGRRSRKSPYSSGASPSGELRLMTDALLHGFSQVVVS